MVHGSLRQDVGKLEGPAKPHLAIELETSELFVPAMLKFAPCKNFSPRADPSKQASKANLICSGSKFFLGANSSGLGIKMLVFSDEELANNVKGSPLLWREKC